jgi:CRISPR-associated protein Csd1
MSWIEKLYRTYENNTGSIGSGNILLLPLYHTTQNAQIQIVLDDGGNFSRASLVSKEDSPTIIPATEESAGRAGSKMAPHPLCDTLQYVAGDYLKWGGNPKKKKNESGYEQYIHVLQGWVASSRNRKLESVLTYIRKCTLIKDLVEHKLLFADANGLLMEKWDEVSDEPPIFKAVKTSNKKGQYEIFIRFSVELPGEMSSELWKDSELQQSWSQYYPELLKDEDLCMVVGKMAKIASNHPKNIRYPGDGTKLISSNDKDGFTYRGRFTNDKEACGVSIEITQKAHNALRWLIAKQGRRDGDQAIVAWAVSGADLPDPTNDTLAMLFKGQEETAKRKSEYTAQEIGEALKKLIGGYSSKLNSTEDVVVMGLDSAMPGKGGLSVTFYRELLGAEFLNRVMTWHDLEKGCVWRQYFAKDKIFVGAPAPRDIAECAYGKRLDEKLRKATAARILPCIVDGTPIPRDLVESCVRRASNRQGIEFWEGEKALGIACALYKHQYKERNYKMSLERERKTRDYLYGRLLAVAEFMEGLALNVAGENRDTNAARLMQRFADHPYSTWRNIELALVPYKTRLRAKRPGFLSNMEKELDEIKNVFQTEEYMTDNALSGEFLIAYHCERKWLWDSIKNEKAEDNNLEEIINDQKGE